MKIEVLKAGSTLSEAGDARFTLAASTYPRTRMPTCGRLFAMSTKAGSEEF